MSDPFGSFEKPNPYGDAPFAGQPRPAYGVVAPRDPSRRPGTVLAAGIVAIVSSAAVALLSLVMILGLIVARTEFADQLRDEDGSLDESDGFIIVMIVLGVVVLLMCAGAILCAALMLRRSNAARIVLVVLAGLSIVASLLMITAIVPILTIGAAVATIVLVFVGGANEWFRPPPTVAPYAPQPPYPPYGSY